MTLKYCSIPSEKHAGRSLGAYYTHDGWAGRDSSPSGRWSRRGAAGSSRAGALLGGLAVKRRAR